MLKYLFIFVLFDLFLFSFYNRISTYSLDSTEFLSFHKKRKLIKHTTLGSNKNKTKILKYWIYITTKHRLLTTVNGKRKKKINTNKQTKKQRLRLDEKVTITAHNVLMSH